VKDWGAAPSAVLMDEAGTVGKAYAARTTPHMYVIDPAGKLVFAGGIDDKRSSNPADIPARRTSCAPRWPTAWRASRWPHPPPRPTAAASSTTPADLQLSCG
jgi:hypothetical protein